MPELPEVETVCADLRQHVLGQRILDAKLFRANLRTLMPDDLKERITGLHIESIERRAKYILMHLTKGIVLISHLGMSGSWRWQKTLESQEKHDHVLLTLEKGVLIFNDPRRFGMLLLSDEASLAAHPLLAHLGPEPLEKAFSPAYLAGELKVRKGPVKPTLMDQQLVVGVGNIYASEALFEIGMHPATPAHQAVAAASGLQKAIRKVLKAAIKSGGSTLRDYRTATGKSGYFQHQFKVYGRTGKPCFQCNTAIAQITQAGRSSFFCPECQKPPRKTLSKKKRQ